MLTESGTLHSVIYTKGTPAEQWTKSSVSLYQNTIGEKAGVLHPTKLLAARPLITFSSLFLQSARHLCCFPLARRDHSNHLAPPGRLAASLPPSLSSHQQPQRAELHGHGAVWSLSFVTELARQQLSFLFLPRMNPHRSTLYRART